LQTDGGNITVGQAGNLVSVRTGGGQIDFGEVRGSVRAQTGGGGIRIMYVSGPMEVESSAGSICLTRVAGTVRAATAGGTITAWINPDASSSSGGTVRLPGLSQLTSGNGDIVVFLPRNLAADIDAIVESGGERRIEADPALALTIQNQGSGPVHAMAALNGGGAPLKLRTNAGKIRLQFLDSEIALRQTLIHEQRERLSDRLNGVQVPVGFANSGGPRTPELAPVPDDRTDWVDRWLNTLETAFLGGIHEDPDEFQKHLVSAPAPGYPEIARRAGVQGIVRLQVHATKDGRVEVDKIINGSPTLADAAICAVKQWRVRPFSYSGRPVEVISTLTFNFQLH
jgi:TonB family protein